MRIVTLDFESYYDQDYSLSKLTTEAYVRDPRFEVIGVGVSIDGAPAKWYTGDKEEIQWRLSALALSEAAVLCHNTVFDGAILAWHFGITPKLWLDTLSMARPLHSVQVGNSLANLAIHYGIGEKGDEVVRAKGKRRAMFTPHELMAYGEYCCKDVELTFKLFNLMKKHIPASEIKLIDQVIRMFTHPVIELDTDVLTTHLAAEQKRKADLLERLGGDKAKSILMSNDKFAALLTRLGVSVPMKISPTTNKPTFAFSKTDKHFVALTEHDDPMVQAVVTARLGVKSTIEESRTQSLIGVSARGALPIMLNYYGAHTGRLSGGDKMNLQNLPRGGALRRSLKAPKGKVLVACDSSQIEARMVAYIAGQRDLVDAFRAKRDVYSEFASEVYHRLITKTDKLERFVGKTSILGLGYNMGGPKFQRTLEIGNGGISVKIDMGEAARIVALYREKNFKIAALWKKCHRALRDMADGKKGQVHELLTYDGNELWLPNGMKIQYPALMVKKGHVISDVGMRYIGDQRTYREFIKRRVLDEELDSLGWVHIFGGKMTENCLAGDTEVLTDRGWVFITDVKNTDMLWDGVEWVNHDGLINQGIRATTVVDGVGMTPDHKVNTEYGWVNAEEANGYYRSDFWLPDGTEVRGQQWPSLRVGVPLCMWNNNQAHRDRRNEVRTTWGEPQLRMPVGGEAQDPRHDQAPSILGVAQYVRQVQTTDASSMEELWWQGNNSLSGMGQQLRGVLGGYEPYVSAGAYTGSKGQQRSVRTVELPVGDHEGTSEEQTQSAAGGYSGVIEADWYSEEHATLPVASEPVYDLRNAGPRSCFVVRGRSGPFVVHNCVQALARIVVTEQMAEIGKYYPVVLQVHDEIVVCVDEAEGENAKALMEQVMSTPPKWAPDLPVACEAGIGYNYGEAH